MARARSALGLRGRIAGVVLLGSVVTLAVAAVALLGPLEHSLRSAEQQTLKHDLGKDPTRTFRELPLCTVVSSPHGQSARALRSAEAKLASRIGGVAVVLGNADRDGSGATPLILGGAGTDPAEDIAKDRFEDAAVAFRTGRTHQSVGTIGGTEYARRVIRFEKSCPVLATTGNPRHGTTRHGTPIDARTAPREPSGTGAGDVAHVRLYFVLAVRKSIAEVPAVARVVRNAFFDAALAALGITLLLGIPLSGRLVRRLRRLREVAIEAEHDAPTLVPVDTANDEVGDLARALASMQERIRDQEEARRSFVATASHELRTPLASLDGMLELLGEDLEDRAPDIDDARALLGRARAQSRRLGRLAADLLDLSRIDAQVQLRSEPVELGEMGRAVLAEFELGTAERRIRSVLESRQDGAVWALGDPGSIARILRILLDNALRASPPRSTIVVTLQRGEEVRMSVSDEGPGVRAEERDAIFERFSRGRDTAGQAGFGLGLAIGRELARRMGGDLELGPGSGAGATFTLTLPAALAAQAEPVAVA